MPRAPNYDMALDRWGVPREAKPVWSAVPREVRDRVESLLGASVAGARRAFGGYRPSATFVLTLAGGRRAFFKGIFPSEAISEAEWRLNEEERAYEELGSLIRPWAPQYYGSVRSAGWHAILIEAVGDDGTARWTRPGTDRAARSLAEFHAATIGQTLPTWLPMDRHRAWANFWAQLAGSDETIGRIAAIAESAASEARRWLEASLPTLLTAERAFAAASSPWALVHGDMRPGNIRLQGEQLRIFDWPFARVGYTESDLAVFAESLASEYGPDPETVVDAYAEVRPVAHEMLVGTVVELAGALATAAPEPVDSRYPRLRSLHRRELKSSLRWAARMLSLDEPRWLATVAD